MKVKKIFSNAFLPQKAHSGDLGYDLFAYSATDIVPNQTKLVRTGIAIEFPAGYGGIIKDRSSIATKKELFVVAGVIDNGYTGEIRVAFHNASDEVVEINPGDKIAQLILVPTVDFAVEETEELVQQDERGAGGFGSTGG